MFGHDDGKKKARRPLPQGILSRTMPPHKPRDNKAAEDAAKAKAEANARANAEGFNQNAYAFGQNSQLHANGLPMRPSSSHAVQPPSALAPAQGYHSRSPSYGGSGNSQRELPSVFGFKTSPPPRPEAKKAPYPVSMYGDASQPGPHPVAFGLLSSPTVLPAQQRPSSSASVAASGSDHATHEYYAPGLVHPHAAQQMRPSSPRSLRSHTPRLHHTHPPTPPQNDKYSRPSPSATAAHNQSAFLQNSAIRQPYAPLGDSEIRLIRISPSSSGKLQLAFVNSFISNPHPYVALSYAWGHSNEKIDIEVDGCSMQIGKNLYDGLRKLQAKNRAIFCWADALSINQADKSEVTHQVQKMYDIYGLATGVAIWLGPSSKDSDVALDLMSTILKHDNARNDAEVRRLLESPRSKPGIVAMIALFERAYWRRLWVVQEVLNAKYVVVHCGASSLPWDVYQRAADVMRRNEALVDRVFPPFARSGSNVVYLSSKLGLPYSQIFLRHGPAGMQGVRALMDFDFELTSQAAAEKFLTTLGLCRTKLATDIRDKVYGLLGIVADEVQSNIVPDYTLSAREVYTKAATYIINTTKRLDVLCQASHLAAHSSALELPTWVPDWSQTTLYTSIDWPRGQFSASADVLKNITVHSDRVVFDAIYIDKVRVRGCAVSMYNRTSDFAAAFLQWFSLLQNHMRSASESELENAESDFCQIITLENAHPNFSSPATWRKVTLHIFAKFCAKLLPHMPMHKRLAAYARSGMVDLDGIEPESLIHERFARAMAGRSFFLTDNGIMGLGSGFMEEGNSVVVPFGCSTPLLLHPDTNGSTHRLVSDAYVNGFMHGLAVSEWTKGRAGIVRCELN